MLREAVYEGVARAVVHDSRDVEPIQCYQEMTQTVFDFVLREGVRCPSIWFDNANADRTWPSQPRTIASTAPVSGRRLRVAEPLRILADMLEHHRQQLRSRAACCLFRL